MPTCLPPRTYFLNSTRLDVLDKMNAGTIVLSPDARPPFSPHHGWLGRCTVAMVTAVGFSMCSGGVGGCVRGADLLYVRLRVAQRAALRPPADVPQLPRASCQLLRTPSCASLTEWVVAHTSLIKHAHTSQHCNVDNFSLDSINHTYLSCGDRQPFLESCNWACTHQHTQSRSWRQFCGWFNPFLLFLLCVLRQHSF